MITDLTTIYNLAPDPIRLELLGKLGNPWYLSARRDQIVPRHPGVHMIRKGRGWGKTRAGSEWIVDMAARNPGTNIAIVGSSEAKAYHLMLDGESGIFAVSARYGKDVPVYNGATGYLRWKNGSKAFVRGFDSKDSLVGFNHQFAWVDTGDADMVDDSRINESWTHIASGNRYGENPQILVTSGVRANWLTDLAADKKTSGNPYWTFEDSP